MTDFDEEVEGLGFGVLDGEAAHAQERVIDKGIDPDGSGWRWQCKCQHCNRPYIVTIPWDELVVASCKQLPLNRDNGMPWIFNDGVFYPSIYCSCGTLVQLPITADKCERLIRSGISLGKLNPQQVNQMRQNVIAQAQRPR